MSRHKRLKKTGLPPGDLGPADFLAAALAGALFLGVGQAVGMVPEEVHDALGAQRLLACRSL